MAARHWETEPNRKVSGRQEKRIAKGLGLRLTPGSGSGDRHKGDATDDIFRIEMKITKTRRIPVTADTLELIWKQAVARRQRPLVVFTMPALDGPEKDWVMMERGTYEALRAGKL